MNIKIALVGNCNNNFFSLCRHLRDRGYHAELFILKNESWNFYPGADTYTLDFMQYTYTAPFGNLYWFNDEIRELQKNPAIILQLKSYDIIFACNSAIAYLEYFKIPIHFIVPHGMDIVKYPFYVESANPNHRTHLDIFSSYQREGIKNAKIITGTSDMALVAGYGDSLKELDSIHKLKVFKAFPYIYEKIYKRSAITSYFGKCDWSDEFRDIKKNAQLVIFSHARHTWKSQRGKIADKANDKIFLAFKNVLDDIKHLHPRIVTFEYGDDFLETKKLIHELQLEEYVIWMPVMRRKDIMVGLHFADLSMGQFLMGCIGGGVQTEALVSGTPLVHYVDRDKVNLADIYPFAYAKDEHDIACVFKDYISNRDYYISMAEKASLWIEQEISIALDGICQMFN